MNILNPVLKAALSILIILMALTGRAQSLVLVGPIGSPPDELVVIYWDQLAGHSATLQWSQDGQDWRHLATYAVAPARTEWHANLVPANLGSAFFRTVQTIVFPPAFAMLPEDAFR